MRIPLRRFVVGGASLVYLCALGCVQIPYYLPELNYVASIDAKCRRSEVHVFRVDVAQKMEIKEGLTAVRGEAHENYELTRIQPSSGGTTSQQVGMSFNHGWRYVGFWNHCTENTSHSLFLRFYRPGFETIELKAGQDTSQLEWRQAADLDAQEKAMDDLLGVAVLEPVQKNRLSLQRGLEPGSRSRAHREALLFGAREYERLAGSASEDADDQEQHARLIDKANRLRALAEGKK